MLNFGENMLPGEGIPNIERPETSGNWQQYVRNAIRDPQVLCQELGLVPAPLGVDFAVSRDFPLFVPRPFLNRMRIGDPCDPLLLQVLPLLKEADSVPGFALDPVEDELARSQPGLLQKYAGRVLLVTTGVCAVHCRYCFRRHYPYQEAPHSIAGWEPALHQIAADPTIEEVILSGGDPLMIVDSQLAELVSRLTRIPHLQRLRVHTRLPILIPQRVTSELLSLLTSSRLTPVLVIHANHAAEFDQDVTVALEQLQRAGILLLNQSVLLRNINDTADALEELSRVLIKNRVLPYYLHQLDRVHGAAHFEVPREEGQAIMAELTRRLPGYAVPRYVEEIPHTTSKRAIEFGASMLQYE